MNAKPVQDVYQMNGYRNREDYLRYLAEDSCRGLKHVEMLADLLGEDEDFDGLVSALEDWQEWE